MPNSADAVAVRVPAKINLHLGVGSLRPDGYHELRTVFHAIDLFDTVTAAPGRSLSLRVIGAESGHLPSDDQNLAWRAATALAAHAGIEPRVNLLIDKAIPVAAGLAGGSADAAAALLACDRLWQLGTGAAELDRIAAGLGSDVTFALHGRSALGAGRGEQLTALPEYTEWHWVLAAAGHGLSTPAVYRELDKQRAARCTPQATDDADPLASPLADPRPLLAALATGDPALLAPLLSNDLQPAALALAPRLADTLAAGRGLGALAGIVSGSGPSCVFLARDRVHAVQLATDLAASGTCRFARAVVGGVAGATALDRANRTMVN